MIIDIREKLWYTAKQLYIYGADFYCGILLHNSGAEAWEEEEMSAFIGFSRQQEYCDVQFCLDDPDVEEISDRLAEISGAEMNAKNWAALISFYLEQHRPELLEDYTCDSDEDTYFAFYPSTKQGEINGRSLRE